jgi:hypothetical protein
MTAHKHFKHLVRTRMDKTGESYTTARRHVLREAGKLPAEGPARWHLPGNIPATTALRVLLTAAGVRDPRTGEPISEAMLFGIGGGIGIGVAAFRYEKADFSSIYIAGRHLWQDDVAYMKAALGRFGIEPRVLESSGAKPAEKHLREALASGGPCVAWVDMVHLPHRGMPQQLSGGGYHVITVYSIDDKAGTALIGDLADEPVEIALSDLTVARGRIKSFKNRLMTISAADGKGDLVPLVRDGLAACHKGLTGKPVKGGAGMGTLTSLKIFAERLSGSKDKEAWERMFPRGHHLWQGLMYVHEFIEYVHTGGGLCRPIFAESVAEAAELPGMSGFVPVGRRYAELGAAWTELAWAALPEGVPLFREARELCSRRAELSAAGGLETAEQRQALWKARFELRERARKEFPLSEAETADLLESLQEKVLGIYELEVAAHAALGEAVA